jgi:hypothetical protein
MLISCHIIVRSNKRTLRRKTASNFLRRWNEGLYSQVAVLKTFIEMLISGDEAALLRDFVG